MRILLSVPTFESISTETYHSIWNLDKAGNQVDFCAMKGYDCARARNEIAKKAINGGYDFVMMLDSDIIVPEDALIRMMEKPADMVLGCYPHGHREDQNHFAELFRAGQYNFAERIPYSELNGTDRIKVKGGGLGCALINVKALKELSAPQFKYVTYDNGSALSEDLFFCLKMFNAGKTIEADPRVKCGHVTRYFRYE